MLQTPRRLDEWLTFPRCLMNGRGEQIMKMSSYQVFFCPFKDMHLTLNLNDTLAHGNALPWKVSE